MGVFVQIIWGVGCINWEGNRRSMEFCGCWKSGIHGYEKMYYYCRLSETHFTRNIYMYIELTTRSFKSSSARNDMCGLEITIPNWDYDPQTRHALQMVVCTTL